MPAFYAMFGLWRCAYVDAVFQPRRSGGKGITQRPRDATFLRNIAPSSAHQTKGNRQERSTPIGAVTFRQKRVGKSVRHTGAEPLLRLVLLASTNGYVRTTRGRVFVQDVENSVHRIGTSTWLASMAISTPEIPMIIARCALRAIWRLITPTAEKQRAKLASGTTSIISDSPIRSNEWPGRTHAPPP